MDTNEFMGEYLNPNSCNEDDIVEILDEGVKEKGKWGINLNLAVQVGTRRLCYTPHKTAIETFRAKFGPDTKTWVNKKFQIKFGSSPKGIKIIKPICL